MTKSNTLGHAPTGSFIKAVTTDAKPLTFYHASPHRFEFPDYEALKPNTTGHDNGHLGLWVARENDWIKGFGQHVYQVMFSGLSADLPYADLVGWATNHSGCAFYAGKRNELLAQGIDHLRLVEADGRSEMGIIINFDSIVCFSPLNQTDAQRTVPGQPDDADSDFGVDAEVT